MKRSYASVFAICFLAVSVPISGCVAGTNEPSEESVGEAQSAFAEATCGTDTISPDVLLMNSWAPGSLYGWELQSTVPYGDPTYCTDAFRVVNNTLPPYAGCTFKAKWNHVSSVSLPSNQTDCEHSYVRAVTYDTSGNQLATSTAYGYWLSGGSCVLGGAFGPVATTTAQYAKLGIAVAYVASCFTDPVSHRLICLRTQDGVQTLTSCP